MRKGFNHVIAGWVLVAAVSTVVAGVKVDYSHKVDFSGFKTYAWKKGREAPSLLTEKRIHTAVDEELKAKGFTRVEESPDLYVVTHTASSTSGRLDVNGFGYAGYGWTGWQDFSPAIVSIRENYQGTMIVDFLDGKEELVWRGMADENLGIDPNPEKVGRLVQKLVKQMFKNFPPNAEK